MNKKGDINLPMVIVVMFIAVILLVFSGFIFNRFNDIAGVDPAFNDTITQGALADTDQTFKNFDYTIFFIFIGFVIFVIISSRLIRTNTIFVPVMIVLLILITIFAMIFSNIYQGVVEGDTQLQSEVQTNYPITNFIFYNLPFLIFIVDLFSLIALFAKKGGENI